jgi:hypothetical protein
MKVIGKTTEGYICTVTTAEVKSLLSINDARREDINKQIGTGTELTFTEALAKLNLIKDLKLSGSYTALNKLEDTIELLSKAKDIVEGLETPLITLQKEIEQRGIV